MKDAPQSKFQNAVIYEIYIRSFYDSNGDGVGDIKGIIDHLDYLGGSDWGLGVNTLWLTPFYKSPMADFGYDVSDYCEVDPIFGSLDDFKKLVHKAHQHNMKVLVDFIPNHTSDQHAWFQSSKSSRDNPKRSWYIWSDPKADGSPPNNWKNIFGGSAWEWDAITEQYYLHSFLAQQPDLNWSNPEVQAAMKQVLVFWSELGVDGFRVDAVEWMSKDPSLADDPLDPEYSPDKNPNSYHSLLHHHSKRGPDLSEFMKIISETVHSYPDQLLIFEAHPHYWNDTRAYTTFYRNVNSPLTAPFNLEALSSSWQAESFSKFIDGFQEALDDIDVPIYAFGNHDCSRLASRVGPGAAPTAAMLLLTLPGIPVIYYGDELGMTDSTIPQDKLQDQFEKNNPGVGIGRDPERVPLPWTNGPNAGFSSGTPWLPIEENYQDHSIETQLADETSLFNLYRQLLQLRDKLQLFQSGSYQSFDIHPDVFCYKRANTEHSCVVILNFSDQAIQVSNDLLKGQVILSTYQDNRVSQVDGSAELRPHEGLIIQV